MPLVDLRWALVAMLAVAPLKAFGADAPAAAYSAKGADTCLKCHDEDRKVPVVAIFRTPHGRAADGRTPMAKLQCESCHGPGAEHARNKPEGEKQGPIRTFGLHAATSPAEQDSACLACHADAKRSHWPGSGHETAGVPCAACHQVHAQEDPVRSAATQPAICGTCHVSERAASLGYSAHPLRQGKMSCTDCHAVHGSVADAMLVQPDVNETCYSCHADKRGPFLWEHPPASEDCTLCHQPHGSPNPRLLSQRPPQLCQQCHAQAGHPSLALTGAGLPGNSPSAFLLGSGCANCHSQVHGSNHPSGAGLAR